MLSGGVSARLVGFLSVWWCMCLSSSISVFSGSVSVCLAVYLSIWRGICLVCQILRLIFSSILIPINPPLLGNPVGVGGPELGEHEDVHDDNEDHGQGEGGDEEAHVEPEVAVLIDVKPTGEVA